MKRVMIVGASVAQIPAILKAKEMGYCVGVADYDPEAVGIEYADDYFNVSSVDCEGVYKAAEAYGADGITTVATDMPMRAIAYACEKLGLAGISYDTAVRATDKKLMIQAFEKYGLPHPRYITFKAGVFSGPDKITYPCICKPVDSSASRGVIVVRSEAELQTAIAYSTSNGISGEVIVEEILKGREVSVETFSVDGNVEILAVTDKLTSGPPHFVEMGHSQPSAIEMDRLEPIMECARKAVRAVGIHNGPAHVEIMSTADGPKLIELGARLGGDFITTDLVPLSTGIDMLGETIRFACGDEVDLTPKRKLASAIRFIKSEKGVITGVTGLDRARKIPGITKAAMLKSIGTKVGEFENSLDRVCYVVAEGKLPSEAVALCERALSCIKVHVNGE